MNNQNNYFKETVLKIQTRRQELSVTEGNPLAIVDTQVRKPVITGTKISIAVIQPEKRNETLHVCSTLKDTVCFYTSCSLPHSAA